MGFIKVLGIILGVLFCLGMLALIVINGVSIVKTLVQRSKNKKSTSNQVDRKEK